MRWYWVLPGTEIYTTWGKLDAKTPLFGAGFGVSVGYLFASWDNFKLYGDIGFSSISVKSDKKFSDIVDGGPDEKAKWNLGGLQMQIRGTFGFWNKPKPKDDDDDDKPRHKRTLLEKLHSLKDSVGMDSTGTEADSLKSAADTTMRDSVKTANDSAKVDSAKADSAKVVKDSLEKSVADSLNANTAKDTVKNAADSLNKTSAVPTPEPVAKQPQKIAPAQTAIQPEAEPAKTTPDTTAKTVPDSTAKTAPVTKIAPAAPAAPAANVNSKGD